MAYIIWALVGVVIALLFGAGPRRRLYRPSTNSSVLAGAFGAVVGGVIGDGVPHALAGDITLMSVAAAAIGALLLCWAARDRVEDAEP